MRAFEECGRCDMHVSDANGGSRIATWERTSVPSDRPDYAKYGKRNTDISAPEADNFKCKHLFRTPKHLDHQFQSDRNRGVSRVASIG